ncbi:MAG: hypothetical protein EZS28_011571, partial [Streblomastix strix]
MNIEKYNSYFEDDEKDRTFCNSLQSWCWGANTFSCVRQILACTDKCRCKGKCKNPSETARREEPQKHCN